MLCGDVYMKARRKEQELLSPQPRLEDEIKKRHEENLKTLLPSIKSLNTEMDMIAKEIGLTKQEAINFMIMYHLNGIHISIDRLVKIEE